MEEEQRAHGTVRETRGGAGEFKQGGDAGRRGRVAGEVGGTWREARIRRAHASSLELGEPARPPLDVPDASIDLLDFSSSVSASFHRLGCRPKPQGHV